MEAETGSVKYLCTFAEEYNTCKYLDRNTHFCKYENTQCGFRKEIKLNVKSAEKYVRQERWYEKYYKK